MRTTTRLTLVAAFVVAGICSCSSPDSNTENPAGTRPNVLLIIGDDMGVETLAAYGLSTPTPTTATLDALAERGVRFNNFWAQPVCSPTRATIMTGRYGFRTGVGRPLNVGGPTPAAPARLVGAPLEAPGGGGGGMGARPPTYGLPATEFMLPIALNHGASDNSAPRYATAAIGKWHLGDADNGWTEHPRLAGFDYYEAALRGIESYFGWNKVVNGEYVGTTRYPATDRVDAAINWITEQSSRPWFMWLGFTLPHNPLHLPPEELWQSDHSAIDPAVEPDPGELEYFHAMIEAMDTETGRLLSAIDPAVLENTYVIFIGDNGTVSNLVNEPFRPGHAKGSVYEGGVNVPLIVSGPTVAAGGVSNALVNSTDLFATILDMADRRLSEVVPEDIVTDSVSFAPYLSNPELPSRREWLYADVFFGNFAGVAGADYAMRNARYKLLRSNGNLEFYDLENDPYEHENLLDGDLSAEQQQQFLSLQAELATLRASAAPTN